MDIKELRIGNHVYYGHGKCIVESGDFETFKNGKVALNEIPLTEEWLLKLPKGLKYPNWIKYLHELQNWYYWNNNKKDLVFKI